MNFILKLASSPVENPEKVHRSSAHRHANMAVWKQKKWQIDPQNAEKLQKKPDLPIMGCRSILGAGPLVCRKSQAVLRLHGAHRSRLEIFLKKKS
jgi:hypothetical protein